MPALIAMILRLGVAWGIGALASKSSKELLALIFRGTLAIVKSVASSHIMYRLWITSLKLWMLAWVYGFLCMVMVWYLGPLVNGFLALIPGWSQPVMIAVWQFVNATDHIVPWTTVAILAKWYITIRLFILVFHLALYVADWSKRVINFVMGS